MTERIERSIYGSVVKRFDKTTGELYAVKRSKFSELSRKQTDSYAEDPRREAKILQYLHDIGSVDSIIKIISHGDNCRRNYHEIVMEYVPDCLFLIVKTNKLQINTIKDIFRRLLEGVAFIHKNNICHMDLSLENILIAPDLTPKICDFGLARYLEKPYIIPKELHRKGKYTYMSPEYYACDECDGRKTDVFALGVCLFAMLYRTFPWTLPKEDDPFFRKIYKEKALDIVFDLWNIRSNVDTIDFIYTMLCPESSRLNVEDILNHPWMN